MRKSGEMDKGPHAQSLTVPLPCVLRAGALSVERSAGHLHEVKTFGVRDSVALTGLCTVGCAADTSRAEPVLSPARGRR